MKPSRTQDTPWRSPGQLVFLPCVAAGSDIDTSLHSQIWASDIPQSRRPPATAHSRGRRLFVVAESGIDTASRSQILDALAHHTHLIPRDALSLQQPGWILTMTFANLGRQHSPSGTCIPFQGATFLCCSRAGFSLWQPDLMLTTPDDLQSWAPMFPKCATPSDAPNSRGRFL